MKIKVKNNYTPLLISLVLLSFSFGPCDESLPLYQEPAKVFKREIKGTYGLAVVENVMSIFFTIWNDFDETLQGKVRLNGVIEVVSARDPSVTKTFPINAQNIVQIKGYDRETGTLTIDPRDSIIFLVRWDLVDDNGRDLKTSFFNYIKDPTCNLRCLAFTENFIISGHITVFDKTGPLVAEPINYSFCFSSNFVDTRFCAPIITSAPCNLQPPQSAESCSPTYFGPIL